MELAQTIEALLFSSGEALSLKRVARVLEIDEHQIREALPQMRDALADRGQN